MLIDRRAVVTYRMAGDFVSAIIGQKKPPSAVATESGFQFY